MTRYALIFLALALASCSPQKRLQRLLDKHPELTATDTVTVPVIVPPDTVRADLLIHTRDTITMETERQVVRVVRIPVGSPCDTAAVALDLLSVIKADTVYVDVVRERLVPCPLGKQVASWWRVAALVLFLVTLALAYFKR